MQAPIISHPTVSEQENERPSRSPTLLLAWTRNDSVLRNSAYVMATSIGTAGIGYVYWVVAAHLYSAYDVGLASALIGAMMLTSDLSSMGIGSALIQILPTYEAGERWSLAVNAGLASGVFVSSVAAMAGALILPLISPEYAEMRQAGFIIAFVVGVPLWTIAVLLDQTFVAERAAGKTLVRNILFAILKIPLLLTPFFLAQTDANVLGIFTSWTLAAAFSFVVGLFVLVPRLGKAYRITRQGIVAQGRRMISSFTWHHLINLGIWAPGYLLPVIVIARLSAISNAYFYVAWMLSSGISMIPRAVATALFAEGSHTSEGLRRKMVVGALIVASLAGPTMLVLLLGGPFILSVFGPAYAHYGSMLFAVFVISSVPGAVVTLYVALLRVRKRLGFAAVLTVGTGILTLIIAWVTTPAMGIVGAGIAWFIGQTTGSVIVLADIAVSRAHQRKFGWAEQVR